MLEELLQYLLEMILKTQSSISIKTLPYSQARTLLPFKIVLHHLTLID